ncbi:MAG: hypothetical protein AB1791_20355 [Chloroflexota bacterium]
MLRPTSWWDLRSAALAKAGMETADLTPIYVNAALFTELKAVIVEASDAHWSAILDDLVNLYGLAAEVRQALDDAWFGR